VSGNIDAPEGGLDAIMQAIVCDVCEFKPKKKEIIDLFCFQRMLLVGEMILEN
jgi:hypothetical protein